jgi:hypothetical protein
MSEHADIATKDRAADDRPAVVPKRRPLASRGIAIALYAALGWLVVIILLVLALQS